MKDTKEHSDVVESSVSEVEKEADFTVAQEDIKKPVRAVARRRAKRRERQMQSAEKPDDGLTREERNKRAAERKKKGMIIGGSIIGVLLAVYFGFSIFFMSHFFFGTQINGTNFSGKTVSAVEKHMKKQVDGYELKLVEADGGEETIKGTDIGMVYKPGMSVKKALDEQNAFLWFLSFFDNTKTEITIEVEYNQEQLNTAVAALSVLQEENQTAPVPATPSFDGNAYVITPEVEGNQINQETFLAAVSEHVGQFRGELNLKEANCYNLPAFRADSQEVIAAKDTMNRYAAASITYDFSPDTVVVDKALISTWLTVDANMAVTFNKEAVETYVDELCGQYNTVGKTKTITTPTGKTAQVSGGIYGWKIARDDEVAALIANIEAGETVSREPVYAQKAAAHGANEWGNTYVEVDLSTQYMWFVSNGAVVFETAVITGLPKDGRTTPQGVNPILEKMRNKTLRGDKRPDGTYEYETPVDYWMRVTWTGIGFHDATWQPAFGGELYKTRGSHGCINMNFNDAAKLYDMISVGTPVIIHY